MSFLQTTREKRAAECFLGDCSMEVSEAGELTGVGYVSAFSFLLSVKINVGKLHKEKKLQSSQYTM